MKNGPPINRTSRLRAKALHVKRSEKVLSISEKLTAQSIFHQLIDNEIQDWCWALYQNREPEFCSRTEIEFNSFSEFVGLFRNRISKLVGRDCIVYSHFFEENPAFLVNSDDFLRGLMADPYLGSKDGYLFLDRHASSGVWVDYGELLDDDVSGRITCALSGRAALIYKASI